MLGRLFRYLIVFPLVACAAGLILLAFWFNTREPLSSLPPPLHNVVAPLMKPVILNGRRLEHIVLPGGALGDIGLFINMPDPLPSKKLPILIVLGGLGTGESNIRMLTNM